MPGAGPTSKGTVIGDVFAVVSAVLVLGMVVLGAVLRIHLELRALEDGLWFAAFCVLGSITVVCVLVMWGWMIADCLGELATTGRSGRLIAWLAVMILVYPTVWLYYFLVRKRRHGRATRGVTS